MDIRELLEELEKELADSKNIPFSKKGAVDLQKCETLIANIRRELPSAIQEATYLLSKRDQILADANDKAQRIIDEAKENASTIVSNSALVKASQQKADDELAVAEKRCSSIQNITRENIDKMLKSIEDYLMENLHIVRNNREELAGTILQSKKKN